MFTELAKSGSGTNTWEQAQVTYKEGVALCFSSPLNCLSLKAVLQAERSQGLLLTTFYLEIKGTRSDSAW